METSPIPTLPQGIILEGRWALGEKLGAGGFATVYRGKHLKLERDVAVKVLEVMTTPAEMAIIEERFLREAKLCAQLEHPNIVQILDYGFLETQGQRKPFIVMELLRGHDLEHELLTYGPLEAERAKRLFDGALDALRVSHSQGIVHRDLKPSNLYLANAGTPEERMVVLDFGIARVFDDPTSKLTATQSVTGTPAYLAPEYIESHQSSPAVDVYQMGLIIGEALSGTPVVQASAPLGYLMAHVNGMQRLEPELLQTTLGQELKRAISVDPQARHQDAGQLKTSMASIDWSDKTRRYSTPAAQTLPETPTTLLPAPQQSTGAHTTSSEVSPSGGGMGKLLVVIALLLVLIGGASAAIYMLSTKRGPEHLAHQASLTHEAPIAQATAPDNSAPSVEGKTQAPTLAVADTPKTPSAQPDATTEAQGDAPTKDTSGAKTPDKAPNKAPKANEDKGASAPPSSAKPATTKTPKAATKAGDIELFRPGAQDTKLLRAYESYKQLMSETELQYRAILTGRERYSGDEASQAYLSFSDVSREYTRAAGHLSKMRAASPKIAALDAAASDLEAPIKALGALMEEGYELRMARSKDIKALDALSNKLAQRFKDYHRARDTFANALYDAQAELLHEQMTKSDVKSDPAAHHYYGTLLELTRAMRAAYGDDMASKVGSHLTKAQRHYKAYSELDLKKLYPDVASTSIFNDLNSVMRSAKVMFKKFDAQRATVKKGKLQGGARGEQTIASAKNYTHMGYGIAMKRHFARSF